MFHASESDVKLRDTSHDTLQLPHWEVSRTSAASLHCRGPYAS